MDALLLGAASALPHALLLAVGPLMARHAGDETHPKAQRILALVRQEPGISTSELGKRLGVGWGSFYLHLKRLEDAKLVVVLRGRFTSVYPKGKHRNIPRAAPRDRIGASARHIALLMARKPGLDATDYMKLMPAIGRRKMYYHIARFVQKGYFRTRAEGRYVGLQPTAKVLTLLNLKPE